MSDIEKEYCLRCQIDTLNGKRGGLLIANCDRFRIMKHSPSRMYAFTEQGVAMLSAVLKSDIAIRESIRMRQVHEDHLRHLPRPLHHRRSEGNLLENAPKKRTCVSQGRFGESRTRRAHKRLRRVAQGRMLPDLRRREDGSRSHPWASRFNPYGNVRTAGIR